MVEMAAVELGAAVGVSEGVVIAGCGVTVGDDWLVGFCNGLAAVKVAATNVCSASASTGVASEPPGKLQAADRAVNRIHRGIRIK